MPLKVGESYYSAGFYKGDLFRPLPVKKKVIANPKEWYEKKDISKVITRNVLSPKPITPEWLTEHIKAVQKTVRYQEVPSCERLDWHGNETNFITKPSNVLQSMLDVGDCFILGGDYI